MPKTPNPQLLTVIGNAVSSLIEERGVTDYRVAKEVGTQPIWIAQIRKGKGQPSLTLLINLADYFGVSVDFLLGRAKS